MSKTGRYLLRALLAVLGVLATGCGGGSQPVSQYTPAPSAAESTVKILDFVYTPSPHVRVGGTVRFAVVLNRARPDEGSGNPYVIIGSSPAPGIGGNMTMAQVDLNDRGVFPDQVADDAVWTGEFTIPRNWPTEDDLPVIAHCDGQQRGALDLKILREED